MVNKRYVQLFYFLVTVIFLWSVALSNAATLTVDNTGACNDTAGNPFCTIQSAVTNATAGDVISVKNGLYVESVTIAKDDLSITGESTDGVVIDGSNTSYTIHIDAAHNITVSTLTIKNADAFNMHVVQSTGITITDVVAVGQGQFVNNSNGGFGGIDFNNVNDSIITNVRAEDHSKNGFSLLSSNNVNLSDFIAKNNGQSEGWAGLAVYTFSVNFPLLSGNDTTIQLSGTNIIENTPMGIYLEDIAPYGIDIAHGSSTSFINQSVAPLVRLGLGSVPAIDTFAQSLGVPVRGTGGVPTIPTIEGYFNSFDDAYASALNAPNITDVLILDLSSNTYFVGDGMLVQSAADDASNGDTILVGDGVFVENIILNSEVRLLGTGFTSTSIVDCGGNGAGIQINQDNTVVSGFEVRNCNNGIRLNAASSNITNNSLHDNNRGMRVDDATDNAVHFNSIYPNTNFGIENFDAIAINATLNWWGSCDGPSGVGNGSGDAVSALVDFDPWDGKNGPPLLGVCIHNKTNVTCAIETEGIVIGANISTAKPIIDISFVYTHNGTHETVPATNVGGDLYEATIPVSLLSGGQNFIWNVLVTTDSGQNFTNGNRTVYVRNQTTLIISPPQPDGLQEWYVSEPLFSLAQDVIAGPMYYHWNGGDPILYAGSFGLEDITNPPKESAGILELNWFSDFGVCGNESMHTQIFHVDLTDPLFTMFTPANNSIVLNNNRPNISVFVDEVFQSNSGVNTSLISMTLDGVLVNATLSLVNTSGLLDITAWFVPPVNLSLGKHNVTVNATDIAGRNGTVHWMFDISTVPLFGFTVHDPQGGNYSARRLPFNITATEEVLLEFINLNDRRPRFRRLCVNCDEYGVERKRTKTFRDGFTNITIRATSVDGFVMEKNVSFFIDSRPPRVPRTAPRRNAVVNGSGFSVRYTEDNLQKVELFYNASTILGGCLPGRNQECSVDVNLSSHHGEFINFFFEVSDSVNTVRSRTTSVFVDTVPPVLTVTQPENITYGRRIPFNITVSEDVLLEFRDADARRPRFKRLCNNCDEYGTTRNRAQRFRFGPHEIIIRATDRAGNTDEVSIQTDVS